jgi:hypothetical protein
MQSSLILPPDGEAGKQVTLRPVLPKKAPLAAPRKDRTAGSKASVNS